MLNYTTLERHAKYKHSTLLGPFTSYEENGVLNTIPGTLFTTVNFIHNLRMEPVS
jgi:hypothetical protein